MRLFVRVLALLVLLTGTFAGVARALDFDDEDPHPPHPEIGLLYHYEIGTHAGCLPHRVVIQSGQLPPGLKLSQLNDHTALVDGIATEAGTFSVWLAVKDCANKSAETLFTFEVWGRRFSITTEALPPAGLGAPYSKALQTGGIPSNTTWAVASGSLPAGLTLSKEGVISGTPTAPGPSTFTVEATGVAKDFTGTRKDAKQLTLNVVSLAAHLSRAPAEVGVAFRSSLVATGGQAPYTWSAQAPPAGLTIALDGSITGTPSRPGTYTLMAHVVDASGAAANVQVRVIVRPRLTIATKGLPVAAAARRYRARIAVRGGVGGLRWSVAKGTFPRGLTLSSRTGAITGTPSSGGSFRVRVRVRDGLGAVAVKTLVLNVR